ARAGPGTVDRLMHSAQHGWMLAHTEIIVRAPDCYGARPLWRMMNGAREFAAPPENIGKHAVTSLQRQRTQRPLKLPLIIHQFSSLGGGGCGRWGGQVRPSDPRPPRVRS